MTRPIFVMLDYRIAPADWLGYIPTFISIDDLRPLREQLNENYIGGWHPQDKWVMLPDNTLHYPGEPPMRPVAVTKIRGEALWVYPHGYCAIVQNDGLFEVAHLD
jgi:hypothetical protein